MVKHVPKGLIKGQTLAESAMLMPLFLMLIFALFQVGHLGIGLAIVNYAASSIARQAVAQNGYNQGDADAKFKKLLFAGVTSSEVKATPSSDADNVTTNLKVTACGVLTAYPLVGQFLEKSLHAGSTPAEDACSGVNKWMGPIGLKGPPYQFIIQGQSTVRMNYNAGKPS